MIWDYLFGSGPCGQRVEATSPLRPLDLRGVDYWVRHKIESNQCLQPEEVERFKRESRQQEHFDYRLKDCCR